MMEPQQPPNSAEEGLSSECYSEDQKYYQHILKMVKLSRAVGGESRALQTEARVQDIPLQAPTQEVTQPGHMPGKPSTLNKDLEDAQKVDGVAATEGLSTAGESKQTEPFVPHHFSPDHQEGTSASNLQGGDETQITRESEKCKSSIDQAIGSKSAGSPLAPLGSLAPIRGLVDVSPNGIRGSMSSSSVGSSGGFESLLAGAPGSSALLGKPKTFTKSTLGGRQEERISLGLPGLEEEDEERDDDDSEEQSPRGSARLLKNLHMDIGSLGGGFEYEESEPSDQVKELNVSDHSNEEEEDKNIFDSNPRFKSLIPDHILDVTALSPVSQNSKSEQLESEKKEVEQMLIDEERRKRAEAAEREEDHKSTSPPENCTGRDEISLISSLEPARGMLLNSRTERVEPTPEEVRIQQKPQELPVDTSYDPSKKTMPEAQEEAPLKLQIKLPQEPVKEIAQEALHVTLQEPLERMPQALLKEAPANLARETDEMLEKERVRLLQERTQSLLTLQEKLKSEEQDEERRLQEKQAENLRAVKEKLKLEAEQEETRERDQHNATLRKLREQLLLDAEEEKRKISAEKESMLQKLREEMESLQRSEQENLQQKKCLQLEKLKEEVDRDLQTERTRLVEEKERVLQELKSSLKKQREEALEELEYQHSRELQKLKDKAEEEHHKVLFNMQKQISESKHAEEPAPETVHLVQKKLQHVSDYERDLSELLQEKRKEVEEEHERRLGRLKEEHKHVLQRCRDQYEEEERKERARLVEKRQDEWERLTSNHEHDLATLRQDLEKRLEEVRRGYWEKERKMQNLEEQLELRNKELQMKSSQLNSKEEALKKAREKFQEEEDLLNKDREEAAVAHLSCLELEETKKQQQRLQESVRQLRNTLEELQDQKVELEAQVELLQNRSQRLQKRISDLEADIRNKQEVLKELSAAEKEQSILSENELRVEDLRKMTPKKTEPTRNEPSSPPPQKEDTSLDDLPTFSVRHYISSEGVSIKGAKEFLQRQTKSIRKRQTALKAARQQWRHDMHQVQDVLQDTESSQILEDVRRNLEQEAKQLEEMKVAMRKGHVLLKKKEERLNQLESSLLEELSEEDTLKGATGKKVVTFDLSDSDDTSSCVLSTDLQPNRYELPAELQFPQRNKVQYLSDSLQRITSELNGVLSILGSLSHPGLPTYTSSPIQVPPAPPTGLPLSTYTSLARAQAATGSFPPPHVGVPLSSKWAWSPALNTSVASASQSVDTILMEKWRKYFPGGIPSLSGSPAPLESNLGYISASEQLRLLHHSQLRIPENDRHTVQGMIDSNKRWLENFKNDPKVPLFARTGKTPGSPGVLQLGLDENNQIKVYHY
ncbi:centrosomal protein of 164 kDa isoform X2 [Pleurodeles waltl]|uniref:centrosomal protein of 164 kDa isoform X2 n=1 Tax=Pleurodeles waltl TaxID=8319 RepID=UPI0037097280